MSEHEHIAFSEYTECDICRFAARLKGQFGRYLALYLSYHGSDDFDARTRETREALLETLRTLSRLDHSILQTLKEFPLVIGRMAQEVCREQPPS